MKWEVCYPVVTSNLSVWSDISTSLYPLSTSRRLKDFRHVLVGCNLLFVAATITPLLHGLGIELHTQRCVNFVGSHIWMGGPFIRSSCSLYSQYVSYQYYQSTWMDGPYTWFTLVVFSLQPICLETVKNTYQKYKTPPYGTKKS